MARTKTPIVPKCEWLLASDDSEAWMTGCGEAFQFTEAGPRENGMRFCCYCGLPLVAVVTLDSRGGRKRVELAAGPSPARHDSKEE